MEIVRFFLAGYTLQRIKFSRSQTSKRPGEAKQKNAANQQKMACSGTFGTPGWVRTSGLSLRRRPLYPTELRGLIQKIFNFRVQPDSNELPLRRRTLYPAELQKHKYKAGRMILMRSALYDNLCVKKNQVLFLNKHPQFTLGRLEPISGNIQSIFRPALKTAPCPASTPAP